MVVWKNTAIDRNPRRNITFDEVIHVTRLESATKIVGYGYIQPYPEVERGAVLKDLAIKVVFLSPTQFRLNRYGCVGFVFDWDRIIAKYGRHVYGLEETRTRLWSARILLSHRKQSRVRSYNPKSNRVPWQLQNGEHYTNREIILQIAVSSRISLDDLKEIRFFNQKLPSGKIQINDRAAERLFLARAVSRQLPKIKGFSGINPATQQPYQQMLDCWDSLATEVWKRFQSTHGTVRTADRESVPLARNFLRQYCKLNSRHELRRNEAADKSEIIALLFRAPKDLILSIRKVVARWAGVGHRKSLGYPE